MANFHGQTVDFVGFISDSLESPMVIEGDSSKVVVGSTECLTLGPKCLKLSMIDNTSVLMITDNELLLNKKNQFTVGIAYHSLTLATPSDWGEHDFRALVVLMVGFTTPVDIDGGLLDGLSQSCLLDSGNARMFQYLKDSVPEVERSMPFENGHDYWINLNYRRNYPTAGTGTFRLRVTRRWTGELIGEKTWTIADAGTRYLSIGLNAYRSNDITYPQSLFFSDLVADYTNAQYPLLDYTPSFSVSFDSQGGSAVASQTIEAGGLVSQPSAPTRSGYSFGGWYREAGCTTPWTFASDTVTAARTLYAKWSVSTHRVTFDSQGGSPAAYQDIDIGAMVGTIPVPYRAGYVFLGWFTQAAGAGVRVLATTVPTADMTAYASWIVATAPVGECSMAADSDAADPVNEGSTKTIEIAFRDEIGTAMAPDTIAWSLYDQTDAIVHSRQNVPATPGKTVRIVLSGADHDSATDRERRKLVVKATYTSTDGAALPLIAEFEYSVTQVTGL